MILRVDKKHDFDKFYGFRKKKNLQIQRENFLFAGFGEKNVILRFWQKTSICGFGGKRGFCAFGEKHDFTNLAGKCFFGFDGKT